MQPSADLDGWAVGSLEGDSVVSCPKLHASLAGWKVVFYYGNSLHIVTVESTYSGKQDEKEHLLRKSAAKRLLSYYFYEVDTIGDLE